MNYKRQMNERGDNMEKKPLGTTHEHDKNLDTSAASVI